MLFSQVGKQFKEYAPFWTEVKEHAGHHGWKQNTCVQQRHDEQWFSTAADSQVNLPCVQIQLFNTDTDFVPDMFIAVETSAEMLGKKGRYDSQVSG